MLIENNCNILSTDVHKGVTVTMEFPYRYRALEDSMEARIIDNELEISGN